MSAYFNDLRARCAEATQPAPDPEQAMRWLDHKLKLPQPGVHNHLNTELRRALHKHHGHTVRDQALHRTLHGCPHCRAHEAGVGLPLTVTDTGRVHCTYCDCGEREVRAALHGNVTVLRPRGAAAVSEVLRQLQAAREAA